MALTQTALLYKERTRFNILDEIDNNPDWDFFNGEQPVKDKDPNGLDQHSPGAKLDAGKPDLDLVLGDFSNALWAVGEVGTYGANKYSRSGWLHVKDGLRRYASALFRHQFLEKQGEENDPETGLKHAAHLAWNALAYLELKIRQEKEGTSITNNT